MYQLPYRSEPLLKTLGLCSPYIAVITGVFLFKNAFIAVFFYHLVLLAVIIKTNKSAAGLLFRGFHKVAGPLICLGGIVPGIVILYLWPIAKQEQTELSEILAMLNLKNVSFILFAIYASIVNPFLEESFWRGCFNSGALHPNVIDMLFAGYHALVVSPVLKAPFVLLVFLAMIFVGWFFRMLYRITGGLAIPLLTHIIADIAILFAIWRIMQ